MKLERRRTETEKSETKYILCIQLCLQLRGNHRKPREFVFLGSYLGSCRKLGSLFGPRILFGNHTYPPVLYLQLLCFSTLVMINFQCQLEILYCVIRTLCLTLTMFLEIFNLQETRLLNYGCTIPFTGDQTKQKGENQLSKSYLILLYHVQLSIMG